MSDEKFAPLVLGMIFNTSKTLNVNMFTDNFTPRDVDAKRKRATTFRVTVCLTSNAKLSRTVRESTTEVVGDLNEGVALVGGREYNFSLTSHPDHKYNFRIDSTQVVKYMYVEEVVGEVI